MQVYCLTSIEELRPYAADWDRLGGEVPMRSWAWLSTWWRHYGPDGGRNRRSLAVFCVFDELGRLVGAAPWFVERTAARGRTLKMLGSGEVCSDYLRLLSLGGWEGPVARAVADELVAASPDARDAGRAECGWDLLELSGIDAGDRAAGRLLDELAERGLHVHLLPAPRCWRIALPRTWDDYLAMLSKRRRRQLRRLDETLVQTGRARLHVVERLAELPEAYQRFLDLHGRRRRRLGGRSCFDSARFRTFHAEVMPELLRAGQLQLAWLEIDGQPAAAEYQLVGGGTVYAYQSGVDPERLDLEPGNLITMILVRRAIEQGFAGYDFLRGDEPYKAQFRAEPRGGLAARVVPNRPAARARHRLWAAGDGFKRWLRSGIAGR
jgi:CelD/BcsL family acetyltransferase involved in cellulose biosynthesis